MKTLTKSLTILCFGCISVFTLPSAFAYVDSGAGFLDKIRSVDEITDPFSYNCSETALREVYSGDDRIYVDSFHNTTSKNIYLWENRLEVQGNNYLAFNNTLYPNKTTNLLQFNYPLLNAKNWKIAPGEEITHLTTAEQI